MWASEMTIAQVREASEYRDIQAAFVVSRRISRTVIGRETPGMTEGYTRAFMEAGLAAPFVPDWAEPVWHLYVLRHPERDQFRARLAEAGIGTVIHYPIPPHLQNAYSALGFSTGDFPLTERLAGEIISLPMCPAQTEAQTEYVIECVRRLA